MILAGDIGGTNTRLALVEARNGGMQILFEKTFPSREKTSLESALAEEMRHGDPAPLISQRAIDGKSPQCIQALDLFVSLYGAEAGNMALKIMATGGVYLGGGIAPKIVSMSSKLRESGFMNAFTDKGHMRPLLHDIPVRVILNPKTALLGAARHAAFNLGT
ncbi:MAG: glucokinase [Pseudomonadota bacterium]